MPLGRKGNVLKIRWMLVFKVCVYLCTQICLLYGHEQIAPVSSSQLTLREIYMPLYVHFFVGTTKHSL